MKSKFWKNQKIPKILNSILHQVFLANYPSLRVYCLQLVISQVFVCFEIFFLANTMSEEINEIFSQFVIFDELSQKRLILSILFISAAELNPEVRKFQQGLDCYSNYTPTRDST